MEFKFNSLGAIVQPKVSIHRLDLEMIGYLNVTNLVIKPTFCSLTELAFTCFQDSNFYDCIKKDMVLEVDGFGRFVITEVKEDNDGQTVTKEVTANSYEETMNKVTLSYKENTVFKLWDPIEPDKGIKLSDNNVLITAKNEGVYTIAYEYPTLLYIISQQTGWTIAHVDTRLCEAARTMTIDKEQAYGLLVGDVAEAFKCYFVFDTIDKKIYCYDRDEAKHPLVNSGINLSFRNLINTQTISESSDDVLTALTIEGAEGVGINLVNPLGNNVVYDFSYYMNGEEWGMPLGLQYAVSNWMNKIEDNTDNFKALKEQKREKINQHTVLTGNLSVAESNLKAKLDVQAVHIAAGNNTELAKVAVEIKECEEAVATINGQIATNLSEQSTLDTSISAITTSLSFENNFTESQLEQLQYYINGAVYENENFVYTSVMTEADKMEISQQLYEQGMLEFAKLNKGQYEYTCDISPFMFTKDYEEFTKNLKLGDTVNLELEDGVWVTPKIMQVVIDYDNPDNTTVTLSDSFRLANSIYEFSNGYTQTVKTSRKTSLSASKWDEPSNNGFFNTVSNYITNALSLAAQEIVNADNQEFTLGSYGLRGKMYDEDTDTYDKHQVAMTNNVLAFTDDNWTSCKTALGKVTIGDDEYYGLVAEAIFGNIIAGNSLTIESVDKSFKIDSTGVHLENAPIIMTRTNGKSQILINTTDGFKIQKLRENTTNVWDDVLSEDTDGNIVANSIKVETGYIGGWTIKSDGLYSPTGDYIKSNGKGKLSLMTYDNSSATFSGNIYANNLQWRYGESDSKYVFANGYMNGDDWLEDGSVGTAKLNKLWVDEVNGVVADFEEIHASIITTDILKAGYIEAGGIKSDVYFGGKYLVCNPNNPASDTASIWGEFEYVDSQHPNVMSLHESATGHIILNPIYGSVIIGDIDDSGSWNKKHLEAGTFTVNKINVLGTGDPNDPIGLDVSATIRANWIRVNNGIDKVWVTDEFYCVPSGTFKNDLTVNGRAWINGGTAVTYTEGGSSYFGHGVDADIPVGDKTLKVRSGIIIAYW